MFDLALFIEQFCQSLAISTNAPCVIFCFQYGSITFCPSQYLCSLKIRRPSHGVVTGRTRRTQAFQYVVVCYYLLSRGLSPLFSLIPCCAIVCVIYNVYRNQFQLPSLCQVKYLPGDDLYAARTVDSCSSMHHLTDRRFTRMHHRRPVASTCWAGSMLSFSALANRLNDSLTTISSSNNNTLTNEFHRHGSPLRVFGS